jgi:hypothetical protein
MSGLVWPGGINITRWRVTVEDCTQSNDSGKCPKDTWAVSESYFNDSDIGEQITRPGEE